LPTEHVAVAVAVHVHVHDHVKRLAVDPSLYGQRVRTKDPRLRTSMFVAMKQR